MTSQEPSPNTPQENLVDERTSPLLVILWNAIFIGILTGLFLYNDILWEVCVIPFWGALSQTVLFFFGFQLFWIPFRDPVKKGVEILGAIEGQFGWAKVKVPFEAIFAFIDSFNLSFISKLKKLGVFIIMILLSSLILWNSRLGLSPYLPVNIPEEPPLIQSFTVFYSPEGTTDTLYPRGEILVRRDQSIRLGVSILPEANWRCKWSTNQGTIFSGVSCLAQYKPLSFGNQDIISLHVLSPCKTQNKFSSVPITIIDP